MEVIFEANNIPESNDIFTMSNCNGQCSSDSGWCTYDPDSNCWNNGD